MGFVNAGDVIRVHTNSSGFLDGGNFLTATFVGFATLSATPLPRTTTIKDVKAANTAGGTATSGSFQTRTLQTIEGDSSYLTLSSNQFTLPAGKYTVKASAPAYQVGAHQARLQNITDASTTAYGSNSVSVVAGGTQTDSLVRADFTLTVPKVFEIQHRVTTTAATNGYGLQVNFATSEIYTQVEITKIK
jgi:hypothetical protein